MQIDPKLSCTLYSELGVHFVRNIHTMDVLYQIYGEKSCERLFNCCH